MKNKNITKRLNQTIVTMTKQKISIWHALTSNKFRRKTYRIWQKRIKTLICIKNMNKKSMCKILKQYFKLMKYSSINIMNKVMRIKWHFWMSFSPICLLWRVSLKKYSKETSKIACRWLVSRSLKEAKFYSVMEMSNLNHLFCSMAL